MSLPVNLGFATFVVISCACIIHVLPCFEEFLARLFRIFSISCLITACIYFLSHSI